MTQLVNNRQKYRFNIMDNPVKEMTRNTVVTHFKSVLPKKGYLRIFNLPSGLYSFEKKLKNECKQNTFSFVGVERDRSTFNEAYKNMTGKDKFHVIDSILTHNKTDISRCEMAGSTEAHLFFGDLKRFLHIMINASDDIRKEWLNFDAIWLDLCSQICLKYFNIIKQLPRCISWNTKQHLIPVAFTFELAREFDVLTKFLPPVGIRTHEDRINLFKDFIADQWGEGWICKNWYVYKSNSVPMCLLLGYLAPDSYALHHFNDLFDKVSSKYNHLFNVSKTS